jgi:hypothetical protein
LLQREAHIAGDLTQKDRRDVPVPVKGNRGRAAIGMTLLSVRSSLAGLPKAQSLEECDDVTGL